jgi:hypothetical protein
MTASPARSLADIAHIDVVGLALVAGFYAPAFVAIKRGYQAPDTLRERYGKDRSAAKRSLTTDHILPAITNLVLDVNTRAMGDPRNPAPPEDLLDAGTISATLDSAGYLHRLQSLDELYFDLGQLDELFKTAVKWARRKAWFAVAYGAALILPLARYGLDVTAIPDGLTLIDAAGSVILGTLATVSWWQEASARNRLSELCERYG